MAVPQFDASSPFTREALRLSAVQKGASQAVSRAAATLVRRLPVEARRDIQTEYNLPAGRISQDLSATSDGSSVTLTGRARAVGLIEFAGRYGGRKTEGATAKVFIGQGTHTYAGTFIATGKNGSRQIFSRKIVGGRRAPRLPLRALYGPSVAAQLRKGVREDRLADFAQTHLSVEIDRLLALTSP
jgi:hypothetical protein